MSGKHSALTSAALGFLAYYGIVMWHEVFGHGLAYYLLGARHFILTSTSMEATDAFVASIDGTFRGRFVAVAGSLSTIILGTLLYPVLRRSVRRGSPLALRHFLWLVVSIGLFHGFCYIVFSGLFGVGDWYEAILLWPHQILLRAAEVVIGSLVCVAIVRFSSEIFGSFPENLSRLALIPYFVSTAIFCLAGLRVPNGAYFMLISIAPSSLMGQAILLFATPVARRNRTTAPPRETMHLSPTIILVAVIFVNVIVATAPGVHFTLP